MVTFRWWASRGFATAMMVLTQLFAAPVEVKAQCFFLECRPGTPTASPPTPAPPTPMPGPLPRPSSTRPGKSGETCETAGGYTYCVSSVLAPQFGFNYRPSNVTDSRLDTAWVEGVSGDGIGEWIVVDLRTALTGVRARLWNGYHKNAGLYARNNRIRDTR